MLFLAEDFMSLPSIRSVAEEFGINLAHATPEDQETVLVACMRRDLPLAWDYMHKRAHESRELGSPVEWSEAPNSPLGQQLIRIHTDALRPLMEKYCMHGMQSTFVNCCNGKAGGTKPALREILAFQISMQDGSKASPDC